MTDKEKLAIYDKLREMHKILNSVQLAEPEESGTQGELSLSALDLTLYVAEGVFARMSG